MNNTASMVSMPNCTWCDRAVTLLTKHGYDLVILTVADPKVRDFMRNAGFSTVPQVFVTGRLIGGYDDTAAFLGETDA